MKWIGDDLGDMIEIRHESNDGTVKYDYDPVLYPFDPTRKITTAGLATWIPNTFAFSIGPEERQKIEWKADTTWI
jgi:hypothetical protein